MRWVTIPPPRCFCSWQSGHAIVGPVSLRIICKVSSLIEAFFASRTTCFSSSSWDSFFSILFFDSSSACFRLAEENPFFLAEFHAAVWRRSSRDEVDTGIDLVLRVLNDMGEETAPMTGISSGLELVRLVISGRVEVWEDDEFVRLVLTGREDVNEDITEDGKADLKLWKWISCR